jgi:hypothetical protein
VSPLLPPWLLLWLFAAVAQPAPRLLTQPGPAICTVLLLRAALLSLACLPVYTSGSLKQPPCCCVCSRVLHVLCCAAVCLAKARLTARRPRRKKRVMLRWHGCEAVRLHHCACTADARMGHCLLSLHSRSCGTCGLQLCVPQQPLHFDAVLP